MCQRAPRGQVTGIQNIIFSNRCHTLSFNTNTNTYTTLLTRLIHLSLHTYNTSYSISLIRHLPKRLSIGVDFVREIS